MKPENVSLIGLYYQGKDDEIVRVLNIYRSMTSLAGSLAEHFHPDKPKKRVICLDLNEQDRFGHSIFNLLLDNHKKELALALWNAGADEMKADKEGEIPLFQAIRKQHTELVMAIVASMVADGRGDSDLNLYREEELGKFSAFSIAAVLSDIKIVEAMLKAGGNPLAQDYFGMTPLYYAAEKGYEDKVELMLKFIPENLPESPYRGLFIDAYYATYGGNQKICRMIDKKRKSMWPKAHWN